MVLAPGEADGLCPWREGRGGGEGKVVVGS